MNIRNELKLVLGSYGAVVSDSEELLDYLEGIINNQQESLLLSFMHPTQQSIYGHLKSNLGEVTQSLRDIGLAIGIKDSPQSIAHHLTALILMGVVRVKPNLEKRKAVRTYRLVPLEELVS